jgi:hypothetical protein
MNLNLQRLFSQAYTPEQQAQEDRGASSLEWTQKLRDELPGLYVRHGISHMFDAGCNDCSWSSRFDHTIKYQGGDISLPMVASVWRNYPGLDVILHDVTTDPLPPVDVLFVRDVAIHLNTADKTRMLRNWIDSSIPWLLITHDEYEKQNRDFEYDQESFPLGYVNWRIAPWNFPAPQDQIYEVDRDESGRCMALWHRDQLKDII